MNGPLKGIATFALGACVGVIAMSLYFRTPTDQSGAQTETRSASTDAGVVNANARAGTSVAAATIDAARHATLAQGPAHLEAPTAQNAGSGSSNANHRVADANYSFENEMNAGRNNIKKRFDAEPEDGEWAPGAQSTLRASIDALPGRSRAGTMDIECRSTMCSVTMTVDVPATPTDKGGLNDVNLLTDSLQGDWPTKPPASDVFDDRDVMFTMDSTKGQVTVEMFVHRRHQGTATQTHSV